MLRREFPAVRFIQSDDNIGFARANNLGAKNARGEILFFLNPDTRFVQSGTVDALAERLCTLPMAGGVGCSLLNTDLTLQTTCIQSFPTVLNQLLDAEFLRRTFRRAKLWGIAALYNESKEATEVEGICGAAVMISRKVNEIVGGFSEHYFMYGEDMDLCFKIRKAGYKSYYIPDFAIVHHGGGSTRAATSNFATVNMRESILTFLRTNHGPNSALLYRPAMMINSLTRLIALSMVSIFRSASGEKQTPSLNKWIAIFRWSIGQTARK